VESVFVINLRYLQASKNDSMNFLNRLQSRWKVNSVAQVILILMVFACTGFTVLFIKRPLLEYWFPSGEKPLWASILYWIFILPVYNIFLLLYGFVFGQFLFFWEFEKRFLKKMITVFRK
jgi:hypothetical protein